ncbi:MAG: nitrilase-related carbon-nitrogen hydrolase [Candidatus Helarchaeota archaeon]
MLNVSVVQFFPRFLELELNRRKISEALATCISKYNSSSPTLIVLPELAFSGYNFEKIEQVENTAEEIPHSESCKLLEQFSMKNEVFIVAGINEKANKTFYNSAVVFGPEGYITTYRKLQLYAREKEFFKPGDLPLQLFSIADYNIGIMICFDWFYPEIPRTLALMGADLVCHVMNAVIPDGAYIGDTYHCRWNRIFIALANRVGEERDLRFIGRSAIIDPKGTILAQASSTTEQIINYTIEPQLARTKKINSYNDLLNDRRPNFYELI